MEFTPFKKDRKPDVDGHYPWESPGLRARLDAERKAAKPKVVVGVTAPAQTWAQSQRDRDMVERDQPKSATSARNSEQTAFEDWLWKTTPSGDVDQVQRQWVEARERWMKDVQELQPEQPAAESGCRHEARALWYNIMSATWVLKCGRCGDIL